MDLTDKTVLVTGATDGVGRLVAQRLAAAGATVLLHGRDREKGEAVLRAIAGATGSERLRFYRADFAALVEAHEMAAAVLQSEPRLDILINNAGIGGGVRGQMRRETSRDGHELRFAVNYLAPFLLTHRLLPLLRASAPARIVNVASAGQYPIDFGDVMLERSYEGMRAYRQSKLAQVMFTFDLARRLDGSGVTVNCLHPATLMNTRMVFESFGRAQTTIEEGADAILHVAADPALDGVTGAYFDGKRVTEANPQAYDEEARRELWRLSADLAGRVD